MQVCAPPAPFRLVIADLVPLVRLHWAPGPSVELGGHPPPFPPAWFFFGS